MTTTTRPRRSPAAAAATLGLLAALALPAGHAAAFDAELPFSFEELGLFSEEAMSVEINLGGALLRFLAEAVADENEDFAQVVAGLDAVTVRVSEIDRLGLPFETVLQRLDGASKRLEAAGWLMAVRVRDDQQLIQIALDQDGERVDGLVVIFADRSGQAGVVAIRGTFDPAQLGRLARGLDLDLPAEAARLGVGAGDGAEDGDGAGDGRR